MKARIHFNVGDHQDSIVIEGSSPEAIRKQAEIEISKRGGTDPWADPWSEISNDHLKV